MFAYRVKKCWGRPQYEGTHPLNIPRKERERRLGPNHRQHLRSSSLRVGPCFARRIAASVDWSRNSFTMDPKLGRAVEEAFIRRSAAKP